MPSKVAGTSLTTHTLLEVADGLSMKRSRGVFRVSVGDHEIHGDRYTLPILDAFSTPRTLSQGLEELERRLKGVPSLIALVATIKALHEYGFLVQPGGSTSVRRAHEKRFDAAPIHIRMLNDELRTSAFQTAIRQTVTPDTIVLEIGTGTGVLAVTAAKSGARHVYAIESTSMSRTAQRMVDANGVGDRVTVIHGHSVDVDLPERAHVLVGELIGDDPLGENILSTFDDARQRLLVDEPTMIPNRIQVLALPVDVPIDRLDNAVFTPGRAAAWQHRYGLGFGALLEEARTHDHRLHVNSHEARAWVHLTSPLVVADLDLHDPCPPQIAREVRCNALRDGQVSGVLIVFTAYLADGVALRLLPDDTTPENSWGNLLQLLAMPISVSAGQELVVRYRYDQHGSHVGVASGPNARG